MSVRLSNPTPKITNCTSDIIFKISFIMNLKFQCCYTDNRVLRSRKIRTLTCLVFLAISFIVAIAALTVCLTVQFRIFYSLDWSKIRTVAKLLKINMLLWLARIFFCFFILSGNFLCLRTEINTRCSAGWDRCWFTYVYVYRCMINRHWKLTIPGF